MREITVREIHEYFGYRMVCGNDEALNRVVTEGDVNRPGLELSGYFELPYCQTANTPLPPNRQTYNPPGI